MTRELRKIQKVISRGIFFVLSALLIIMTPSSAIVFAEDGCTPVAAAPTGVSKPTGSDSVTYTYNPCTGLWSNQYYTWSPATKQETPKTPLTYTYNSATAKYDAQKWVYSPAKKGWHQTTISVSTPPASANVIGAPAPTTSSPGTSSNQTPSRPSSTSNSNPVSPSPASISGNNTSNSSGGGNNVVNSGSANKASGQNQSSAALDSSSSITLNNTIDSTASSGGATVSRNTSGGSAATGDVQTVATVINQVQSSTSLGGALTFTANIDGDVKGNFLIDPSVLQAASSSKSLEGTKNIAINTSSDGTINNDINLSSSSGNATVERNTEAGNATSGSATTIANVINLMNSLVSSKQSFIGTININGNLRGDILLPKSFYDTLIASNAPRETAQVPNDVLSQSGIVINNDQTITNNVSSIAVSGEAILSKNTQAGVAASGAATTNVTIFNLTDNQIRSSNSVLVFVNVVGKWVGVIMDAPAGTTAVALGSGVTRGPPEANDFSQSIDSNTKQTINNNINVSAASGDATVSENTKAGDATSGDASNSVNLVNITGSYFNSSNWFGILFINVFGNWYGDFGVAGDDAIAKAPPAVKDIPRSGTSSNIKDPNKPFRFEAQPGGKTKADLGTPNSINSRRINGQAANQYLLSSTDTQAAQSSSNTNKTGVLSDADTRSIDGSQQEYVAFTTSPNQQEGELSDQGGAVLVGGLLVVAGIIGLGVEQATHRRRKE